MSRSLLISLLLISVSAFAQAPTWDIERVDERSGAGRFSSIAISNGVPYIAYLLGDGGAGSYPVIAGRNNTGSNPWKLIDQSGSYALIRDLSLASSSNGTLHLAQYFNPVSVCLGPACPTPRLGYRTLPVDGVWSGITTFEGGSSGIDAGDSVSLAVNPSTGRPHLVYYSTDTGSGIVSLRHARLSDGGWIAETIGTGSFGAGTDILVTPTMVSGTPSGRPHILYTANESGTTRLRLRRSSGETTLLEGGGTPYGWSTGSGNSISHSFAGTVTIDSAIGKSMAIDSTGRLHIAFYDPDKGNLMYANRRNDGGGSSFDSGPTAIDITGDVGRSGSIAVCPNDSIHILYEDTDRGWIKYAKKESNAASWTVGVLTTTGGSYEMGQEVSLACDLTSRLHMSFYYPIGSGSLKYATASAAICQNGLVEAGEQCDDDNSVDTDACRNNCMAPVCGDGVIRPGFEACDDGNSVGGDGCKADCTIEAGYSCVGTTSQCSAICGDGLVRSGETCDDGNSVPTDGCANCSTSAGFSCAGQPSTCTPNCGDGIVAGVEVCDAGSETAMCDRDCTVVACGDSLVNMVAGEQCDDGNTNNNDDCRNDCTPPPATPTATDFSGVDDDLRGLIGGITGGGETAQSGNTQSGSAQQGGTVSEATDGTTGDGRTGPATPDDTNGGRLGPIGAAGSGCGLVPYESSPDFFK